MKGYIFDREENLRKIEEEIKLEINKRKEQGKEYTKFLVWIYDAFIYES